MNEVFAGESEMGRQVGFWTLCAVIMSLAAQQTHGQGSAGIVSLSDPVFGSSDSSTQATHGGLVGKRYFEARYLHLRSTDSVGFDESAQGFDVTFNTPLPWTDQLVQGLGTDAFINYGRLGASDNAFGGTMEFTLQTVEGGITLHGAFDSPLRPFVQLGVLYTANEVEFRSPGFNTTFDMDDTSVLVRPGVELDVAQNVAIRSTLDIDTEDAFDTSTAGVELIVGLDQGAYLRGGVLFPLEGGAYIVGVGGGLTF